ncbi:hypothetical protein [Sulfobacillus harzensis]|uniref:Uncharacterized protein n=1 Tax=Sulfobacillus harzensis TaxID=2729629 RepID=A0A7Y0Q3C2_9FIRM|nr:hypothetical protein [Sulfobacillus harzensis]NMP22039.1 hypothetical protein [Sulfobacillus harzensis]
MGRIPECAGSGCQILRHRVDAQTLQLVGRRIWHLLDRQAPGIGFESTWKPEPRGGHEERNRLLRSNPLGSQQPGFMPPSWPSARIH